MEEKQKKRAPKPKAPTPDEQWLLGKMGTHESAWVSRDRLLQVSNLEPKKATKAVDGLVKKQLFETDNSSPFGSRYRLTDKGRRLKLGEAEPTEAEKEQQPGAV